MSIVSFGEWRKKKRLLIGLGAMVRMPKECEGKKEN